MGSAPAALPARVAAELELQVPEPAFYDAASARHACPRRAVSHRIARGIAWTMLAPLFGGVLPRCAAVARYAWPLPSSAYSPHEK